MSDPNRDVRQPDSSIFEAAGGLPGLTRLAMAWHERVMADLVVAHAFHHGTKPDHTDRLAAYLAESLGGPPLYTARYGDQSAVVRLHSGNGEHEEMNQRAVACFDAAIGDIGLSVEDGAGAALHDYWSWATWGPMATYHRSARDVPAGLPLPRWTWGSTEGQVD